MNCSFSEDVLQKMRLQQKNAQLLRNSEKLALSTFATKTNYIHTSHSPKQITYNQIIHDGQTKIKGRYKLRNCKQPNLKIIQRQSLSRQKANSLLGLKQLMKQQMQRFSIKKRYEHVLQKYADNQIAQNLKFDLLFLPNSVKIPHRNRYRPNRQAPHPSNIISINGNKIIETKPILTDPMSSNRQLQQQIDYPQMSKKTAGFQLKYRRHYLTKKLNPNNNNISNQKQQQNSQRQQQFPPLTGWF